MEDDNPYANEKLYTQTEILQMVSGLMNVYWSTPWPFRLFMRPWLNALNTLALQVAGNKIIDRIETDELINDIGDYLSQD